MQMQHGSFRETNRRQKPAVQTQPVGRSDLNIFGVDAELRRRRVCHRVRVEEHPFDTAGEHDDEQS